MRPQPGEVLHFSEEPALTEFAPHVAATARDAGAYVWAVDAANAPSYWFPRQCPRAMAWVVDGTVEEDRARLLGPVERVHLIEYEWLVRMQRVRLYAYRFDAADFVPYGDGPAPHAFVADHPVRPLGRPEPVGDLLALHAEAGIELRLTRSVWPWWREVIASTLGFSGVRLRNALRSVSEGGLEPPCPVKGTSTSS